MILKVVLAYDGTGFRGWASQPGLRTVQATLEEALARVFGTAPKVTAAGRTDAGVHAWGQVVSFEASEADSERLARALNGMLAPEVVVRSVRAAPAGFDARFSATAREYRYRLRTGELPSPFTDRFEWHRPGDLALGPMRAAVRHLLGEHDFASFCRKPQAGGTVRRLDRLAISRRGDLVEVRVRGNAFLHQMVRSLVGTLVKVGQREMDPGEIPGVLEARSRAAAGPVAPPRGLVLERVLYGAARERPAGR